MPFISGLFFLEHCWHSEFLLVLWSTCYFKSWQRTWTLGFFSRSSFWPLWTSLSSFFNPWNMCFKSCGSHSSPADLSWERIERFPLFFPISNESRSWAYIFKITLHTKAHWRSRKRLYAIPKGELKVSAATAEGVFNSICEKQHVFKNRNNKKLPNMPCQRQFFSSAIHVLFLLLLLKTRPLGSP